MPLLAFCSSLSHQAHQRGDDDLHLLKTPHIDIDSAPGRCEEGKLWTTLEARATTHPEEERIVFKNDNLPFIPLAMSRQCLPCSAEGKARVWVPALPLRLSPLLRGCVLINPSRYPEAAGDGVNHYGQLPHHLSAMCDRSDLYFLWDLLLMNPWSAGIKNGEGFPPLQAMWMHDCSRENVGTLLEKIAKTAVTGRIAVPGEKMNSHGGRPQTMAMGVPLPPEVITWAKEE